MKKKTNKGIPTGVVPFPEKKKRLAKIDQASAACHYCGKSYKPMPVYVLKHAEFGKKVQIFVCHSNILNRDTSNERWVEQFECRKKAVADGYEHRPDLGK